MICPHCLIGVNEKWSITNFKSTAQEFWKVENMTCPECYETIIRIEGYDNVNSETIMEEMIYPKITSRSPIPSSVEKEFVKDYREACLVLKDSPKASAALSRRCLQNIIRKKAGIKERDLSIEIDKVLESNIFPSHLSETIDAIRHFGNFSTHPIEDKDTGSIIDVEAGEAEWLLDILEELFDFYYLQPERIKKRKDALNEKLKKAGKKPMRESS